MTSPPTPVEITCRRCGEYFEDFHRPSINLGLGEAWTEDELAEATTATCPTCGATYAIETLIVDATPSARRELSTP